MYRTIKKHDIQLFEFLENIIAKGFAWVGIFRLPILTSSLKNTNWKHSALVHEYAGKAEYEILSRSVGSTTYATNVCNYSIGSTNTKLLFLLNCATNRRTLYSGNNEDRPRPIALWMFTVGYVALPQSVLSVQNSIHLNTGKFEVTTIKGVDKRMKVFQFERE